MFSLLSVLYLAGSDIANQTQTSATRCSVVKLKVFFALKKLLQLEERDIEGTMGIMVAVEVSLV